MDNTSTGRRIDKLPDQSLYRTEGGSNWLAAQRYAQQTGMSQEDVWGPAVHGSSPEDIARNRANADIDRLEHAVADAEHDQDRSAAYDREGGSNFLTAERWAEKQRMNTEQLWGPGVHDPMQPSAHERSPGRDGWPAEADIGIGALPGQATGQQSQAGRNSISNRPPWR